MVDRETKYFGDVGFLYPYDIRFDAADRAYCNPLPDGRVGFRLQTECGFSKALLVYSDGEVQGAPLTEYARDRRFIYWETTIRPARPRLTYSFALRTADDKIVYFCRHGVDHAVEPLDRWELDLTGADDPGRQPPEWMAGAVVYQIFPERFANGDPTNDPPGTVPWGSEPVWDQYQGGDLQGITQHLDYLQELGVDVLYLNPINTSPTNHKYAAVDYYHVDPAFGGDDALRELVEELHQRDMRIVLDASFNHCHPRFFAFQDLLRNGPESPYRDWFTVHEYPIKVRYRPEVVESYVARYTDTFTKDTGIPLEAVGGPGPGVEPTYLAWYNVPIMPKINLKNPDARAYFLDVTTYWLREFEIDGWRMDVARHIAPDFWVDFRRAARAARPDCYLLSEIWGNTGPWLQGDQFDATMNYIFRDLCLGYFATAEMETSTFADGVARMVSLYAPQVTAVTHNVLSSHDTARLLTLAGERLERFQLATFFQLTMPGAPGIYYGDEIGMVGGHDPGCRRAFPWAKPETWQRDTYEMTRELIALRRAHPALRLGDWRPVWRGQYALAYLRSYGDESILVLVNRGPDRDELRIPLDLKAERTPALLWGSVEVCIEPGTLILSELPAWSGAVLLL